MNMNDYSRVTGRIEPSERCRNEVLNMNSERKRKIVKSNTGSRTAAMAAAAVLIAGGAGVTGFHFMTRGANGPSADPEPIVTQTTEAPTEEPTTEAEQPTTEESGAKAEFEILGTSFNNNELTIDVQVRLPEEYESINGEMSLKAAMEIDGEPVRLPDYNEEGCRYVNFHKSESENVWLGTVTHYLSESGELQGKKELSVHLSDMSVYSYSETDDTSQEYNISGDFTFTMAIEFDGKSHVIEKDGFEAHIIKNTPDMVLIGGIERNDLETYLIEKGWDTTSEEYKYNGVHPVFVIIDENNNDLTPIPGDDNGCLETVDISNGGQLAVSCYRPPTDNIRCVFIDKNQHKSPLGTIDINTAYGTNTFEIVADIPIDLSQYPMDSE